MPQTTKKKTDTGLTRLQEVQGQIDEVVNAPAPTVPSSELPSATALPQQETVQDAGFATKMARAIAIFAAGAENPEQGFQLLKNFQAQDQAVKDAIQQRFANAMALQGRQFQMKQFSEQVRSTKIDEQQADTQNRIAALNASLRAIEAELRAAEANDPGGEGPDVGFLNSQRATTLEMIKAAKEQQGILKPPTDEQLKRGLDGAGALIAGKFELGLSDAEMAKIGMEEKGFANLRKAIIDFRQINAASRKPKMTPELEMQRGIIAVSTPILLPFFDSMVDSMPDPNTGDPGDNVRFAKAVRALATADPAQIDMQADALARKWGPDGEQLFSTTEEAEVFIANLVTEFVTFDDVPLADEGIIPGEGVIEKLFATVKDPTTAVLTEKAKRKQTFNTLKKQIGPEEKKALNVKKQKALGTFKEKPKVLFGVKQ